MAKWCCLLIPEGLCTNCDRENLDAAFHDPLLYYVVMSKMEVGSFPFRYVPPHCCIAGNENADALAYSAHSLKPTIRVGEFVVAKKAIPDFMQPIPKNTWHAVFPVDQ